MYIATTPTSSTGSSGAASLQVSHRTRIAHVMLGCRYAIQMQVQHIPDLHVKITVPY